jgi:ABC-2 type transport system permease protein
MKWLTVAKWEYLEKVKTKAFLVSLVLTPAMMIMFGVLPSLFAMKPDTDPRVIGVVDETGNFSQSLQHTLNQSYKLPNGSPNYVVRLLNDASVPDIDQAKKLGDSLALTEEIEGYVIIGKNVANDSAVQYRSKTAGNVKITERLGMAVHAVVVRRRLAARGLDTSIVRELNADIELKTIKISKSGKEEESGFAQVFVPAYVFMMTMFIVLLTGGQMLIRSMLEEKSNRVVEVLISSCSPSDLMMGKVFGLSGLAFTQLLVWFTLGALFNAHFVFSMFTPVTAILLLVYFVLGYLFYAAVFVAVGSPVSTEQEAQQITQYLVFVLVLPIVVAFPVMENPNSMLAHVLSFIPLITPTMMAMRIAIEIPPVWEIAGTTITLGLSAWLMMKVAGKIFRTAVLMQGKRPGISELIKIVRAS